MRSNIFPIVLIASGAPIRPLPDFSLAVPAACLSVHRRDRGTGSVGADLLTVHRNYFDIRIETSWP